MSPRLKKYCLFFVVGTVFGCYLTTAIASEPNDVNTKVMPVTHNAVRTVPLNMEPKYKKRSSGSNLLAELKNASLFKGRYTGFGGGQTDDFLAYERALAKGPSIKSDLEQLLKTASPADLLERPGIRKDYFEKVLP